MLVEMNDGSASGSFDGTSASGSGSIVDDVQEVKGLTFVTARRHFVETLGEPAFEALIAKLPTRTRALFSDAKINEWYPEGELRRFIHLVHRELAEGDDARFLVIARELAGAGISSFFRMILGLTSGRFVLKKIPVLWRRLRRGPAELSVETAEDGRILIHYENFRYCRDPIYRLLSIANCQAAVVAATKKVPAAEVLEHAGSSMTLAFDLSKPGAPE